MADVRQFTGETFDIQKFLEKVRILLKADSAAFVIWINDERLDPNKLISTGEPFDSNPELFMVDRSRLEKIMEREEVILVTPETAWADKIVPFLEKNRFGQMVLFPFRAGKDFNGYMIFANSKGKTGLGSGNSFCHQ